MTLSWNLEDDYYLLKDAINEYEETVEKLEKALNDPFNFDDVETRTFSRDVTNRYNHILGMVEKVQVFETSLVLVAGLFGLKTLQTLSAPISEPLTSEFYETKLQKLKLSAQAKSALIHFLENTVGKKMDERFTASEAIDAYERLEKLI